MDFHNSTNLDDARLKRMVLRHTVPYRHDDLVVRVRYSRGADFSGSYYYKKARIYVNVGRRVRYPYSFATHIAKAISGARSWRRPAYHVAVADGYQLALFVYLHELYHYLTSVAGRSPRRKEAMCDRFAARVLADEYGAKITDAQRRPARRESWDFKDLHAFVAAAPKETSTTAVRKTIPVVIRGL